MKFIVDFKVNNLMRMIPSPALYTFSKVYIVVRPVPDCGAMRAKNPGGRSRIIKNRSRTSNDGRASLAFLILCKVFISFQICFYN